MKLCRTPKRSGLRSSATAASLPIGCEHRPDGSDLMVSRARLDATGSDGRIEGGEILADQRFGNSLPVKTLV
jgi:hypothetical protein